MAMRLDLTYAGIDLIETFGEPPQLRFKIKVKAEGLESQQSVYITRMICEVRGISTSSIEASSYGTWGYLGDCLVNEALCIKTDQTENATFYVPLNTQRLSKMLDVRSRNNLVGFEIFCNCYYFIHSDSAHISFGFDKIREGVRKFTPSGKKASTIVLSTEEFAELIKGIKYFEFLKVEIPIYDSDTSPNQHLNKAIQLLKSASEKFAQNNLHGTLLDIRNALANHVLEQKTTKEGNKQVIREDIKEMIVKNMPTDLESVYEEVLKQNERILNSNLQIIHKFVHEDSDKLKVSPLKTDVETLYFSTAISLRYLSALGTKPLI